MVEKYFHIDPHCAQNLLSQVETMKYSKNGIDRRAFLFDDYVVLSTNRLKLRNVTTRDDDFVYFNQIIETLWDLHNHGVSVLPILGYCYEPESEDGVGYIIQKRAIGSELYDDAVIARFQTWSKKDPLNIYLHSNMSDTEAVDYLVTRTHEISQIPQEHFDKFISDMIHILKKDLLIDCYGQSNFFYSHDIGFQFIDLDAHNDYKYGLTDQQPNIEELVCICAMTPCHYAVGTTLFSAVALDEEALQKLTHCQYQTLARDNCIIFQKCMNALQNNRILDKGIEKTLKQLKIFGC